MTNTTPTATSTSAPTRADGSALQNATSVLGKDDFLRLLVTQLKYQDPLKPTDQSQFMSQMAQFSTVEGINNLQHGIDQLQAVPMIGKEVTYLDADGKTVLQGTASSVALQGSTLTVHVGDTDVPFDRIVSVAASEETAGA
jgi:flagellar basal-body rod modification protein FlgD